MAEQLLSFQSIAYITAPPLVASLVPSLDVGLIFGAAPTWFLYIAVIYFFYVTIVCFSRKRRILSGRADWISLILTSQIYELEDCAYSALQVTKKRELPLDLLLLGGNCAALVSGSYSGS